MSENENQKYNGVMKFTSKIRSYGEILVFLLIAAFFILLAYNIRDSLSPIIVFIVLLILLIPFWRYSWGRVILGLTLLFFSIWVVQKAGYLIVPFIVAILVAYLFDPLITKLSNRSKYMPRAVAALIIFLPLAIVVTLLIILLVPAIIEETQILLETMPQSISKMFDSIITALTNIEITLNSVLPESLNIDLLKDRTEITNYLIDRNNFLLKNISFPFSFETSNITTMFSMMFSYFIIMPLVTFYFMIDISNIRKRLIKILPMRWQSTIGEIMDSSSKLIINYLRGMFILSSVLFIVFFLALSVTSSKYALLLAFIRGLFNVVPFIGPFAAYLVAVIVGAATETVWWHGIIKMSIIYGAGQILDTGFLQPNIIGNNVKMGPAAVMFATIMGGAMFGFVGILVAVPLAGIISIIVNRYIDKYYNSRFYRKQN